MAQNTKGSIIIPNGVDIWEHELKTAQVLARYGHIICFVAKANGRNVKSADILIGNVLYEIKSPKADKLSAIERNLKRASKQAENIVIDSGRMKKIHDSAIQKCLVLKLKQQKTIKRILFVNRKHELIDISDLI
jgi:hypothetical protein